MLAGHILVCLLVVVGLEALAGARGCLERAEQMTPRSKLYSIKIENGGSRHVYAHLAPQANRKLDG